MYQLIPHGGRSASAESTTPRVPAIVREVVRSPGQGLDQATRTDLAHAFAGWDFSQVRVHTDARAAASADAVRARAYTVGQHVVFAAGQYTPRTPAGRRLLGHELTHTLQQRGSQAAPALQRSPVTADPMHDRIVEDWRTTRGLPASGMDKTGQPVGPSAAEIKYSLNTPLSVRTPFELARTPAIEFGLLRSAPSTGGPTGQDYARASRFLRGFFARHGYTFDFEQDRRPLGRTPNEAEMRVAGQLLGEVLRVPGVSGALAGPGARGVPTAPGSRDPSLQGKVRICDNAAEYSIKRYQLHRFVIGQLPQPPAQLDGWVRGEWANYGITATGAEIITDQERRGIALLNFQTHVSNVPGFYLPTDDIFYLAPGANLRHPATQEVLRHETTHLLGGRERTRDAFFARFPDRQVALEKWQVFEEGMAELISMEAVGQRAPAGAATSSAYGSYVATMYQIMADRRVGRAALLNAYFTGRIPEIVFTLLGTPARQTAPRQ